MKSKFRIIHLPDDYGTDVRKSVAQIMGKYYAVIGNSNTFKISSLHRDWGKTARWGKYIVV